MASFNGTSNKTTKAFSVKSGWELRFEVENKKPIKVALLDASGRVLSTPVTFNGPGGGSAFPKQAGTLSLKITSSGKWLVRVFNH